MHTDSIQSPAMALCNTILSNSRLHFSIFFFIIAILFILPSTTNSISFTFPSSPDIIHVQGDSFLADNAIQLTRNAATGSAGRVTYSEPLQIWDKTTARVADFVTHFSFVINTTNDIKSDHGNGITFFLMPWGSEIPLESNQSEIQAVEVEFSAYKDSSPDQVVINVYPIVYVSSVSFASGSIAQDGRTATNVWLTYNSTTKSLSVFLSHGDDPAFIGSSILSHIVDISKVLPQLISVGFSSSMGVSDEINILSWQFNSTLRKSRSRIGFAVGLIVGVGFICCALGSATYFWLKKMGNSRKNDHHDKNANPEVSMVVQKETGTKRFSYSELVYATSNFNEEGKLGQGGFGAVYKGFLSDMYVAVKRISQGSQQGKKECQSEVRIISRLRHKNMVQLIGWCHEKNELLLVYKFMPNRSLDKHLFRGDIVLTWDIRYKIATGLASALLYLHEEWEQRVVILHRDIKSSNVMLDSNFNAKLGDFGLARLIDQDLGSRTTVLAGTRGYLAPECMITGKSSKESDIYSFGVVALEIASGRKPFVASLGVSLVQWVWELYENGKIAEAADERLNTSFNEQQMERLLVLGLWCTHPNPSTRPSIRQVTSFLNFESPLPSLPPMLPSTSESLPVPYVPQVTSSAGLTDTLVGR